MPRGLVGKRVVRVYREKRPPFNERQWGWPDSTLVIEFDDGTLVSASADPEGNGPGCLFGVDNKGTFYVSEQR